MSGMKTPVKHNLKSRRHIRGEGRAIDAGRAVPKFWGATENRKIQHLLCDKKGGRGARVLKVSVGFNGFSYGKFFYKKESLMVLFHRISIPKWVGE